MTQAFDREAIRRGATAASAICVPAAVVSWLLDGHTGNRGPAAILTVVVLVSLTMGGFAAARHQQQQAPLSHAMVAVLLVVALLQVMRIARLAVLRRPLALPATVGNVLLGLVAAVVGGLLAGQKTPHSPSGK